ncbi:MAG: peptidylprolyl isomerase [Cyclobacteriaceae bacterium]
MRVINKDLLLFSFLLLMMMSCSKKPSITKAKHFQLMTIDKTPVFSNEFSYAYEKNRKKDTTLYSENSVKEYLDLFINFKLKVKEAESLGMDTLPSFLKEYYSYKKQLAKPYLSDDKAIDSLVLEAYERSKTDTKASHILLKIPNTATPNDTFQIYTKLQAIRDSISNGLISFGDAAIKYSEDPSAAKNKGDLGYFSVLRMVYPFESAVYTTSVGDVSPIVKTRFGYHILYVEDKKPAVGELSISHIMVNKPEVEKSQQLANELMKKLKSGADWDSVCKEYSDHTSTKNNGGSLKPFKRGGLGVPALEDAAFQLINKGDIAGPIQTQYGYHIIKLNDKKALKPFEEVKDELKKKVKKDTRSQLAQKKLVDKLTRDNGFKQLNSLTGQVEITQSVDSILNASWNESNTLRNSDKLFVIGDSSYVLGGFYTYLIKNKKKYQQKSTDLVLDEAFAAYKDQEIITYETKQLPSKYPEYAMISKEYREGILLFDLMNEKVWKKATKDTVGIKSFYKNNKQKYLTNESAKATIKEVSKSKEEGQEIILDFVEDDITSLLKYELGKQQVKHNGILKDVEIFKLIPVRQKELKEVKGKVVSEYQSYLEKEWIKELRKKYSYELNEVAFKRFIKQKRKSTK